MCYNTQNFLCKPTIEVPTIKYDPNKKRKCLRWDRGDLAAVSLSWSVHSLAHWVNNALCWLWGEKLLKSCKTRAEAKLPEKVNYRNSTAAYWHRWGSVHDLFAECRLFVYVWLNMFGALARSLYLSILVQIKPLPKMPMSLHFSDEKGGRDLLRLAIRVIPEKNGFWGDWEFWRKLEINRREQELSLLRSVPPELFVPAWSVCRKARKVWREQLEWGVLLGVSLGRLVPNPSPPACCCCP